ncbi:DNA polymerase nu [Cyprinodon tularosa]|uniref:DNA polymerase nu n=1 Tax=Cyprinodon tularosa TaxID=77115 RepID=UPI0018E20A72|nr:DNA polymerase nu [Cyprinodon tularosa]
MEIKEQSGSRMYTAPLSEAALRVLAALRAQHQDQGSLNQRFNTRRQMESCNYSRVELWTASSCSQMEAKDSFSCRSQVLFSISDHHSTDETLSHQNAADSQASSSCRNPPLQQKPPQTLPDPPPYLFSQETEESLCQQYSSPYFPHPPNSLPAHQTARCSSSTGILKPAFKLSEFTDHSGPDELSAFTSEQSHSLACHPPLPCSDKPKKTVNLSGPHNEDEATWDIGSSEAECHEPPGSGAKWRHCVSNPSEEGLQPLKLNTTGTRGGHLPSMFQTAEREPSGGPIVQSEDTKVILEYNCTSSLTRCGLMATAMERKTDTDVEEYNETDEMPKQQNSDSGDADLHRSNSVTQKIEEIRLLSNSAGASNGERCTVPTLTPGYGLPRSGFRPPYRPGNQQHILQTSTNSGLVLIPQGGWKFPLQQELTITEAVNEDLYTRKIASELNLHRPPLTLSSPLKRRWDLFQHVHPSLKQNKTSRHPKWEPPQVTVMEEGVRALKKVRLQPSISGGPLSSEQQQQSQIKIAPCEKNPVFKTHPEFLVLKETQPVSQSKVKKSTHEMERKAPEQKTFDKLCKHQLAKMRFNPAKDVSKGFHEVITTTELQIHPRSSLPPAARPSDARIKDSGTLNQEEREQMLEEVSRAEVVVLTLMFQDGTTQLDPEQKVAPVVCGLLVLMKTDLRCTTPCCSLGLNDSLVYFKLERNPPWAQQRIQLAQQLFTRAMLLRVLSRSGLVICYKAKDFLRTVLLFYKHDLSWKEVAGCQIQDPQVSGWLLDPSDPSSCFNDLLLRHCKNPCATSPGSDKVSQIISSLCWLFELNLTLCSKLQSQGLWELYSEMEVKMITILGVMESHSICVDKGALKRTSDLLGTKMKQLEQEAHKAAGQIFLVTSNAQLRTVLFEKLCLHERCRNKKLPKTINKQQQSTSEAALLQLQDLHPLPKIILEYRQVHKIKSTFVDGILSCMKSKNYISSTWCQTSAVTGRISAKHPNFQALPRQPLQISRKQYIQGKQEEVVAVHPRDLFIPQDGWTFLSADFCQVELRLLAHFSSDPELLHIFTKPQSDAFTMLASQWKGKSVDEVTPEDREHAKRVVYSVVYGAGRERLSGILGVSSEQARHFQDSFLRTYGDVQAFIQRTIQQSHKQGYVVSLMGRRRNLPNINSPDWGVRMQAERQAVNFVVQGSAADLCKMAMISIFNQVSSSSLLSARLLAQLHDELLYEVENSQVEEFAALVKSTMESLHDIHHLGVHLKVPLKVAVSIGKSWGSMSELHTPPSVSQTPSSSSPSPAPP